MVRTRLPLVALPFALAAFAADHAGGVPQAANRMEQTAARAPAPLAMEFRMMAAQALLGRHPELARKFVDRTLDQLRASKDVAVPPDVVRTLAIVAPDELKTVLPRLAPGTRPLVVGSLIQEQRVDDALALYRDALKAREMRPVVAASLFRLFARARPAETARLYQDIVSGLALDVNKPTDARWLLECATVVSKAEPRLAADAFERVANAASAPDYGKDSDVVVSGTLQAGSAAVTTTNSRDTLLLQSGILLHGVSVERWARLKPAVDHWDLTETAAIKAINIRSARAASPLSERSAIQQRIGRMRGLPTDADRARLAIQVAAEIRALPPGPAKLALAQSIGNLSTEGDLGKEALSAVVAAIDEAIHQTEAFAAAYVQLASLVRYEHVPAPRPDPALDAADALLALRQQLVGENDFTLAALDGKTYSLSALRGRVVLVNFWATWCPPCRKEMPDMEKLYRAFEKKGLLVLAVSDEERDTVAGFLQSQGYTFPILLDPGHKVHAAFGVEGIPKSFLFNREGRLVAQSIDMRTERQFLEMLKSAGLE